MIEYQTFRQHVRVVKKTQARKQARKKRMGRPQIEAKGGEIRSDLRSAVWPGSLFRGKIVSSP